MGRGKTSILLVVVAAMSGLGLSTGNPGCNNCSNLPELEGRWSLDRGDIVLTIKVTTVENGEQEQQFRMENLESIDLDKLSYDVAEFVVAWNRWIEEVNLDLDEDFEDDVFISFPQCFEMLMVNARDPSRKGRFFVSEFLDYVGVSEFETDPPLTPEPQGGDEVILLVSTMDGTFDDRNMTLEGQIVSTYAVFAGDAQNGVSVIISVAVDYTGATLRSAG